MLPVQRHPGINKWPSLPADNRVGQRFITHWNRRPIERFRGGRKTQLCETPTISFFFLALHLYLFIFHLLFSHSAGRRRCWCLFSHKMSAVTNVFIVEWGPLEYKTDFSAGQWRWRMTGNSHINIASLGWVCAPLYLRKSFFFKKIVIKKHFGQYIPIIKLINILFSWRK